MSNPGTKDIPLINVQEEVKKEGTMGDSSVNEVLSCKEIHGSKTKSNFGMKLQLTDVLIANEKIREQFLHNVERLSNTKNRTSEDELLATKDHLPVSSNGKKSSTMEKNIAGKNEQNDESKVPSSSDDEILSKKRTRQTKTGKKTSKVTKSSKGKGKGQSLKADISSSDDDIPLKSKTKKTSSTTANSSFVVSSLSSSCSSSSSYDDYDEDLKLAKLSNRNKNQVTSPHESKSNQNLNVVSCTENQESSITNSSTQTNKPLDAEAQVKDIFASKSTDKTSNEELQAKNITVLSGDNTSHNENIQTSGKRKSSDTTDTSMIDTDDNGDSRQMTDSLDVTKEKKQKPLSKRRKIDEEQGDDRNKNKKTSGKEVKSKEDSVKLKNLKRYLKLCGYKVSNYSKLFEDCKSMKSKERKIMSMLEDFGVKGRPTLKQCEKVRKKREEVAEVAELNTENVITASGGRTRSARRSSLAKDPKRYDFTGLLDCIDADDENEDNDVPGGSNTTGDKSKKRGRLATTSSEDDDSGDCHGDAD